MQVNVKEISKTRVGIEIIPNTEELQKIKDQVVAKLGSNAKIPGFRSGKAPQHVIEKHLDQQLLQSEFLDSSINYFYNLAVNEKRLKVFGAPKISLTKFVPFTTLEFAAETDVLAEVKLPDYKKIKKTKPKVTVTQKDIQKVLDSLKSKTAERKPQTRAAKNKDELVIDFTGVDTKKQPIKGADGKDYPLILGSESFIPGFESNLVGLKAGEEKTFTLTFPKDYGIKALADKKVTFNVSVKSVNLLTEPKLDDEFASKVGPFKTLTDLKTDIKTHLANEKQNQAKRQLENELIKEIVDASKLELPESLVKDQVDRLKTEIRQNLVYRGQTWQEMLDSQNTTDAEYEKTELLPEAKRRVKTGLVLAEISSKENIDISNQELEQQMADLKNQYKDSQMQSELAKADARQEIASHMVTEKTIKFLVDSATSK